MLHPLTPQSRTELARYRSALPKSEADALTTFVRTYWPYQQGWLLEPATFALLNKARKIGFSHTSAGAATIWGVYHGETTTIISRGDRESKEVLEFAAKFATLLREMGSKLAEQTKTTERELRFASGGRIVALPAIGGRGFSGNVVLDEFAYHEHAEKVWDAAAPVITLGYRLRVVSTPNGVGNSFHNLYRIASGQRPDVPNPWKLYEIPIQRALDDGFRVDMATLWGLANGDARLFEQMYNCSFLDSVLQYIPTGLIDECSTTEPLTEESNAVHYAGLDIGREVDLTALVVVRQSVPSGKLRVVHVETMKRTDQGGIDDMVARAFATYKLKRLGIDSTGLGAFPAQAIKKRHSERYDVAHRRPRVELIDFGLKSKEALATGLYSAMSSETLTLPASDAALPYRALPVPRRDGHTINAPGTAAQLRRELASIQRVITSAANIQYVTPRTSEGHADRAWALMLAVHSVDAVHPALRRLTMNR